MRSVFLEGLLSQEEAQRGLSAEFPDQLEFGTKVVISPDGLSSIGWLYVVQPDDPDEQSGPYMIMADYSGREWDFDAKAIVVEVLRRVQARIGGELCDYDC